MLLLLAETLTGKFLAGVQRGGRVLYAGDVVYAVGASEIGSSRARAAD